MTRGTSASKCSQRQGAAAPPVDPTGQLNSALPRISGLAESALPVIAGFAAVRSHAASRKVPVNNSWIAATAIAHRVPVVTQDSDYDAMPDVRVIKI
jgi:predicted nucleic acid-binding protein